MLHDFVWLCMAGMAFGGGFGLMAGLVKVGMDKLGGVKNG